MHALNRGRLIAVLYLAAALSMFFSLMYVYPKLVVPDDAAGTAERILASETQFRLAIAGEIVSSVLFIFLVLALHRLFRDVNRWQAIQPGEVWFMLWPFIKGLPPGAGRDASVETTDLPRKAGAYVARVAFAILIASLSATAGAQTNEAQARYESGNSALQRGEPERAAALFQQAIELRPSVAQYHDRLANAWSQMAMSAGMFERVSLAKKAKAEWERAVQLDPNLVSARQSLIEFHVIAPAMMGGDDEEAKKHAAEIRRRDPIAGYVATARIHTAEKHPDLARREYDEMLKLHGRSPRAQYLYGVHLMLTEKNYRSSAAAFESALKLDPSYMPACFQLGHVAALAGESFARGEEALKKYLGYRPKEDEPSIARAHYWLGGIYEKQGRTREAKASYETSLRLNAGQKDVREALKRVS